MDSLTQITLGAAVGEAILGRRVGNRAMLWGAVGGTIPDLDVLSNLVTDELSALAYHRAFTHSLCFALLAPPALGWMVHRLYGGEGGPPARRFGSSWAIGGFYLFALLLLGSLAMPVEVFGIPRIAALITAVILGVVAMLRWREHRKDRGPALNPSWSAWSWLFFGAIITHPLLDACTTYGTQLFEPFTALRIGLNNISVVDPLYTLPFLICLLAAARYAAPTRQRASWNTAGLILSSVYLALTGVNKLRTDNILHASIAEQSIAATRSMTSPTIFNNILWSATVETADSFYLGQYGLLDPVDRFALTAVPKNHDWVAPYADTRELRILRWFSQGYFNVVRRGPNTLQINDLRFGAMADDPTDPDAYIFKWILTQENGQLRVRQDEERGGPDMDQTFARFWQRLRGRYAASGG